MGTVSSRADTQNKQDSSTYCSLCLPADRPLIVDPCTWLMLNQNYPHSTVWYSREGFAHAPWQRAFSIIRVLLDLTRFAPRPNLLRMYVP